MQRLIVSLVIITSLAGVACAVAPTPVPPPVPTPTPMTITHELVIIADPPEAADVLLNPTPIEGGRYVRGRTVSIDILPKKGWQVDQWAGPVYDEVGVSAKIDMNSSHTVIVRLVRVIAVPPTAAPSAAVRPTAVPPTSVPLKPRLPRRALHPPCIRAGICGRGVVFHSRVISVEQSQQHRRAVRHLHRCQCAGCRHGSHGPSAVRPTGRSVIRGRGRI